VLCSQQAINFKYLGCEISYDNEKAHTTKKIAKFAQTLGNLKNTLNQIENNILQEHKHIMHWFFPFFYIEGKFVPPTEG